MYISIHSLHQRLLNLSSYIGLDWKCCCTAIFRSLHRCSVEFKSGIRLGLLITFTECSRSDSFVILDVCLGLSKFQSALVIMKDVSVYCIFPLYWFSGLPVPAARQHPHNMILLLLCFTIGMVEAR